MKINHLLVLVLSLCIYTLNACVDFEEGGSEMPDVDDKEWVNNQSDYFILENYKVKFSPNTDNESLRFS